MKKSIILIFLIFLAFSVSGKVIHVFPDLLTPDRMIVGKDCLYVNEEFNIIIYSLNDYSFVKKVGKKGEGPGEFVGYLRLSLYDDHLYVNSAGKLSIFDKRGVMLTEIKSNDSMGGGFAPLNNKFVGRSLEIDKEKNRFTLLNIYNKDLVRERTMIREPHRSSFEKGVIIVFDTTFNFRVFGEKVYLVNGREFKIDVYDKVLKKEMVIERGYKRIKFGEKDKKKVVDNLLTNPRLKQFAEEIMKRQRYPDYYPAILGLYDNGEYLFVMTYMREGNNIEFMLYDRKGKFTKQIFIPFKMKSIFRAFPWSIKGNKFYQLIENEDEEWELHENILDLR